MSAVFLAVSATTAEASVTKPAVWDAPAEWWNGAASVWVSAQASPRDRFGGKVQTAGLERDWTGSPSGLTVVRGLAGVA